MGIGARGPLETFLVRGRLAEATGAAMDCR